MPELDHLLHQGASWSEEEDDLVLTVTADLIPYDNGEEAGLEADNVQDAIDELLGEFNNLSWTAPNYPTIDLPVEPPNGELAYDTTINRLVVGSGGVWRALAYVDDL